ncbi:phospholipid phosphatase 6 isoform X1 [Pararge aegeria]|uniref:phospholipid phosphatase 6 isoform X1 n=2 Tax=Pararge aegeria TaxID=116150 RepID=UPI0019D16AB6|nr:phospholipid phosphatase 6 isoform X1 [Pararge aegeria]
MNVLGEAEEKRKVPTMLQKLLHFDIQVTKKFVDMSHNITALRSLRIHSKFLEVSCHGIVWLAGWLSFIWLFNNKELYQLQVNVFIALLIDIVVIAVLKAFVRRRRPVPMNKLLPGNPDKYSFPSGHSSRAAMIAFIMICVDPISFIFYPPLLAWVGAVALSRVLAERHYFLDVFAGLGIGVLEGLLISLMWFSQSTAISIISTLSDEKKDGGEYHV